MTSTDTARAPASRPGATTTQFDWAAAEAHSSLKRQGDESHGPCPVQQSGKDCFWVCAKQTRIGCRLCGDAGGALDGAAVKAHLAALGALREPPAKAAPREVVEKWVWTTADGQRREQIRYRQKDGKTQKRWAVTVPKNTPRPALLLYYPPDGPQEGVVLMTEGASDADAAAKRGLRAIGRPGAKPAPASLRRLDPDLEYWVVPDCDEAGYKQADAWEWSLRSVGLKNVRVVDMRALRPPDAKDGWDLRDLLAVVNGDAMDRMRQHLRAAEPPEEEEPYRELIQNRIAGAVEAIEKLGIEVRLNTLNGREEFRRGAAKHWAARSDGWESTTRRDIEARFDVPAGEGRVRPALLSRELFGTAVEGLAYDNQENPMLTWLEELPPWDGKPRLDTWLTKLWDVGSNPTELVTWASAAPVLAAVQRQIQPGTKHDEVVILLGGQGVGKSSVLRALCPNPDQWFSDALNLGNDDKQRVESILGRVIVEIADLQGLKRLGAGGVENLKAFLSRVEDRVRLAYRRNPEDFPRRAIVWGTANNHDCLLADESGVRRFIVIEVQKTISVARAVAWMKANRDMLWAEAWKRRGEDSFLPGHLADLNEQHSGQHQPQDEDGETLVDSMLEEAPPHGFKMLELMGKVIPSDSHDRRKEFLNSRGAKRLACILRRRGWDSKPVRMPSGKMERMWVQADPTKDGAATCRFCRASYDPATSPGHFTDNCGECGN